MQVLVLNAGSSSLKYQLIDPGTAKVTASGMVEQIGEPVGRAKHQHGADNHEVRQPIPTHREALHAVLAAFEAVGPDLAQTPISAIGHRVVHGGSAFSAPTLITDELIETVTALSPLAPLHNPANLQGIEVARELFGEVPQVAVFDTAFHQGLSPAAYTYAVPLVWQTEYGVRRYGFHGTSHQFVARQAARFIDREESETNVIVLHLGNGASASAVRGGVCIDTSMGMSPLEGLVMGTRSGDVDPALALYMAENAGLTVTAYDRALNKDSGLKGIAGTNDFRELMALIDAHDANAQLAFDIVCHRIIKYVGAYAALLGRVDVIAFTGGIGENTPQLRAKVLDSLGIFGVVLDAAANDAGDGRGQRKLTTAESQVAAYVIETNEELEIARQTVAVLGA